LNVIGFVITSAASTGELEKKFTQKVGGAVVSKLSDSLVSGLYIDKNSSRILGESLKNPKAILI
jgi:hypothetical protein